MKILWTCGVDGVMVSMFDWGSRRVGTTSGC